MKEKQMVEALELLAKLAKFKMDLSEDKCEDESCEACSCGKEDEDEDEEEILDKKRIVEFQNQYIEIFTWAIGSVGDMRKSTAQKKWSQLHPNLPALFVPELGSISISNIIMLMQVMPHWLEHKKNEK